MQRGQEQLARSTAEAEAGTRDLLCDWDGQPLDLRASDTRDHLEKKITRLESQLKHARHQAGLGDVTLVSLSGVLMC